MRRYDPDEWKERALEKAEELRAAGVDRIDFMRAWYQDETTVFGSEAFDEQGAPLFTELVPPDLVPPLTGAHGEGEVSQGFYSYSPANHFVLEVGSLNWKAEEDFEMEDAPVTPVVSKHYSELVTVLTWRPDLPDDILRTYAQHENPLVRKAVAANPNTPSEVMTMLIADSDKEVRKELARNPALSPEHFEQLSKDKESAVRFNIAKHPNVPLEILYDLSRQTSFDVCRAALWNKRFPYERLLELRSAPNAAEELLALPLDPVEATLDLLAGLYESEDEKVQRIMRDNADEPLDKRIDIIGDADLKTMLVTLEKAEAERHKLVEEQRQRPAVTYARPVDVDIAVARHPSATADMLNELSRHSDNEVRFDAIENPNISFSTLLQLAQEEEPNIYARAEKSLENNDFSRYEDEVLNFFMAYAASPAIYIGALRSLANNRNLSKNSYLAFPLEDTQVKFALVRNPSVPSELLETFKTDEQEVGIYKISDLAKRR